MNSPGLPEVPEVLGELRIDLVYPPEGATVTSRDSTFVFGNVGRGDATLTVNGAPIDVAPNGAWLAFLPVPADGVYDLVATAAGQTITHRQQIEIPEMPAEPLPGVVEIIEGSVTPTGTLTGVRGELVEVRFRGTPGGEARLRLPDGSVVPLIERDAVDRSGGFMLDRAEPQLGVAEYVGEFELVEAIGARDPAIELPTLISETQFVEETARQDSAGAILELGRGTQVVAYPLDAVIGVLDPARPRVAVAATERPDSMVIGRRQTGPDQAWDFFWPNGTRLAIDGEREGFYRVRLTAENTAWVAREDVRLLPAGLPAPRGFVGPSIQVSPHRDGVDVRFSMSERLPFRVEPSEGELRVDFYGATGQPAYVGYGAADDFVRRLDWEQVTDEQFTFQIELNRPLWGFRYRWEGEALILQVRRPPLIDASNPLRGLRVGVDAGHRGGEEDTGATGPTRLTEAEATLAVAQRLTRLLGEAGAEVLEIRPGTTVVPLADRPVQADRANADLLVSIHFNAFPDGVNPFENHGTVNLYYWPQSLGLAQHLQREIVSELGLPDQGVRFQNLAMTRTSWMPAVLTETLFMMFPAQEAALRDPRVIERIANAHFRALESFVRERATATIPWAISDSR